MPHFTVLPFEPRPRDFRARLVRSRMTGVGAMRRRRHTGRRAALIAAAVALPAFAAPQDWDVQDAASHGAGQTDVAPMPFERAGASFPGSAFYYLDTDEAQPVVEGVHSDAEAPSPAVEAGPAARALRIDNSGVDRSRALQCMTAAIYYEAASEPDAGQRAVAQVVLNRVAHPAYPNTVCGVVYQGSERQTGCQFSFTCDGSLARAPSRFFWLRAEMVARAALAGYVYAPVGLATHYHTVQIHPYWADSLRNVGTIGAHRFYRFAGPAGLASAFRFAYAGGEPLAAPHPRSEAAQQSAAIIDPLAVQRAYEAGLKTAEISPSGHRPLMPAATSPAPLYAPELQGRGGDLLYRAERLPGSQVRPEYEASGRWIAQPGA